jgi:hypothetical protein
MPSASSASSASSSDKSIAVLIKKAMAKMPLSLNTKKGIDEYYKNAMKEIVLKIKAKEKAKKDALKAKEKVAKKPAVSIPKSKAKIAKKRRGGYVDNVEENNLINKIIEQYNLTIEMIDGDFRETQKIAFLKLSIKNIILNLEKLKAEVNTINNIDDKLTKVVKEYDNRGQVDKDKVNDILTIIGDFIKVEFIQRKDGTYFILTTRDEI